MPYMSNDPDSPFVVEYPTCSARPYQPCVINEAEGWYVWHPAREIMARANADDLDPLDFQATITTRTIVGAATPGDLSVFLDEDDPQNGRNE